jgi:replicative DNA helicase
VSRFETYLDVVEERRVRRAMWQAGHRIIRTAQDGSEDSRVLLAAEQERLNNGELDRGREGLVGMGEVMARVREQLDTPPGEATGITTGFQALDESVLGWEAGNLILVAGRPGMGKSVLASQFATAAASHGHKVAIFSLEMTRNELVYRMLAADTGISHHRIRRRYLHAEEWARLGTAEASLEQLILSNGNVCVSKGVRSIRP